MDGARGGYFSSSPGDYPSSAVFTNSDILSYKKQVRQFSFLVVSSLLGIHDNRKLWYDDNGDPCSLSSNNANGDDCSFWKPRSLSLMSSLLPATAKFIKDDLTHTLRCACGNVGGMAPNGVYDVTGGLSGIKDITQCPDPVIRCPDEDHLEDPDHNYDEGRPFPWLWLLIISALLVCCGLGWMAFLFVGKNMGDSDRRTKKTPAKLRGLPLSSKMVQIQGKGKRTATANRINMKRGASIV